MPEAAGGAEPEAAAAVAVVLAAPDHYAAVGAASRDLPAAELRQHYLRQSVRVHPDKNPHPDATRAFQRVSAAWAVLSDDAARRRYDAELREGSAGSGGGDGREGPAAQSMSAEDAFAAFAFATAMAGSAMSSRGGVGEFAETLLFAQQLSKMRESGQAPDAATVATGGLALSAGLRSVADTAESLGYKGASKGIHQTASLIRAASQATAIGHVASQVPAVREAVASGTAAAADKAQQLGDTVKGLRDGAAPWAASAAEKAQNAQAVVAERAQQIREGGAAEAASQLGSTASAVLGGVMSWAQRARDTVAEKVGAAEARLGEGARAELRGLQAAAHLNGRTCEVVGFDEGTGRYRVCILPLAAGDAAGEADDAAGQVKLVRRDNLLLEPGVESGHFNN